MGGRQKTMTGRGNKTKNFRETNSNLQERPNGNRETTERQTGRMTNSRNMSRCQWKRGNAGVYIKDPHHALTVIMERADPSMVKQGWVGDRPCLVTVDIQSYVIVARSDITARWAERQQNECYMLQTVSGEALPILKEVFLTLTPGQHLLKICVFIASITNEFILGLDILRACDASVDLGHQMLHLAEEEVSP
jgi:hypothetical protein